MIKVYYDGQCGLCSKEINHYRRIALAGQFSWIDVTRSQTEISQHGISLAQALRVLHAEDDHGQIHRGVDAFILIWSGIPNWKPLAKLVALPPIRYAAQQLYRLFAARRFNRLQHCQLAAEQEQTTPPTPTTETSDSSRR